MKTYAFPSARIIACLIIIGIFSAWVPSFAVSATADPNQTSSKLLSVGKPGEKAIDLKVWTQKPKDKKADEGIPAVVRVKASEKGYLTSIYVSPSGDTIILLPNKDSEESVLLPDKEYTLFGPESRIKLKESDSGTNASIVFFVSSAPLSIDTLKPAPGDSFIRIPQSAVQEMNALIEKLEALSKDPKFNRKVLALANSGKKDSRLDLMGLPTDVKSAKPMGVTGVQGLKNKLLEPGKE